MPVGSVGGLTGVFDLLGMRMDYLKQRQSVIAQNVAHADSPDYKARDLEDFGVIMSGHATAPMTMAVSSDRHIVPEGARAGGDYADKKHVGSYEVLPSGNSVVLEEQMVKIAEISTDYQLATSLYKRMQGMMRLAIGKV